MRTVSAPDPEALSTYYNVDPYGDFLKTESVPVVEGYAIDCKTVAVEPWERVGGLGAYIHLTGRGWEVTSYVSEIPPGGNLKPQQHMYDQSAIRTAPTSPGMKRTSTKLGTARAASSL